MRPVEVLPLFEGENTLGAAATYPIKNGTAASAAITLPSKEPELWGKCHPMVLLSDSSGASHDALQHSGRLGVTP